MGRVRLAFICFGIIGMTAASVGAGERKDVPDKYRWNLADLYPSEAAWTKAKDAIAQARCRSWRSPGQLGKSPKDLLAALQTMFDIDRELSRLLGVRERAVRRGRARGAPARDEAGGRGARHRVLGGDLLGASRRS